MDITERRERIERFFDDLKRRSDEYYGRWYASTVAGLAAKEKET